MISIVLLKDSCRTIKMHTNMDGDFFYTLETRNGTQRFEALKDALSSEVCG